MSILVAKTFKLCSLRQIWYCLFYIYDLCYTKMRSSFNGIIEEIPGIAVDNFEKRLTGSRAFFLSHYHQDHCQGLDTDDLAVCIKKTNACVYTSEITAYILNHHMKEKSILAYVKPLKREPTLIRLPSNPDKGWDELYVEVTLIPAGHSFGSTMFLFKTREKTVLYTGDFRIRINDIPKYGKLHKNGDPLHIDTMYVDTEFIRETYEEFPKRSDTADAVIDEMDKWLKIDGRHAVSVYMYANYTFEFLLNKIYQRLKMKVYINDDKYDFYSKILHLVPGVTNDAEETRIHLCLNRQQSQYHKHCFPKEYDSDKTFLHIYLTAMKWRNFNLDRSPIVRKSATLIDACFSTHCSRSELVHFVTYFNPSKVIGFSDDYIIDKPGSSKGDEEFILTPKRKSSLKKRQIEDNVDKEKLYKVKKNLSQNNIL